MLSITVLLAGTVGGVVLTASSDLNQRTPTVARLKEMTRRPIGRKRPQDGRRGVRRRDGSGRRLNPALSGRSLAVGYPPVSGSALQRERCDPDNLISATVSAVSSPMAVSGGQRAGPSRSS